MFAKRLATGESCPLGLEREVAYGRPAVEEEEEGRVEVGLGVEVEVERVRGMLKGGGGRRGKVVVEREERERREEGKGPWKPNKVGFPSGERK